MGGGDGIMVGKRQIADFSSNKTIYRKSWFLCAILVINNIFMYNCKYLSIVTRSIFQMRFILSAVQNRDVKIRIFCSQVLLLWPDDQGVIVQSLEHIRDERL